MPKSNDAPQAAQKKRRVPIDGVLMLDKPVGLSSNQALGRIKWLLNAEKAGHTGTLDPFATGLLPLCFGEATKFSADLLNADKSYRATMRLGQTTDTGDCDGQVTQERPVDPQLHASRAALEAALQAFTGKISQTPPMYSALKRDGKPLYAYAREGITLERAPRVVTIHALALVARDANEVANDVVFDVRCSKGTYVRTLAEDIGERLGCGAHLVALRRTGIADITLDGASTLSQFEALEEAARPAALQPVDALLSALPQVALPAGDAVHLLQGRSISFVALPLHRIGLMVRVYDPVGQLLGTARVLEEGTLQPVRLVKFTPPTQ